MATGDDDSGSPTESYTDEKRGQDAVFNRDILRTMLLNIPPRQSSDSCSGRTELHGALPLHPVKRRYNKTRASTSARDPTTRPECSGVPTNGFFSRRVRGPVSRESRGSRGSMLCVGSTVMMETSTCGTRDGISSSPQNAMVLEPAHVRDELRDHGFPVGSALYEKCLWGSGVYPLGANYVVKAELVCDAGHRARMQHEGHMMVWMDIHAVGPKVICKGSFEVAAGSRTLMYMIMERFMLDLDLLSTLWMPSTPLDHTAGLMLTHLFKRTAYHARILLTDLKPSNVVVNLDLVVRASASVRVTSLALIDFGPEYCLPLTPEMSARTAYLAMLLLYFAITTSLGFTRCAAIVDPFIARCSQTEVDQTVAWMDGQPVVGKAIRQYTTAQSAAEIYAIRWQQDPLRVV